MKLLYILNIANRVNNFSYSSMVAAQRLGIDFHIAGNWGYKSDEERIVDEKKYGIHIYQIDFCRAPYDLKNIKAYKQLCEIHEKENFDVIHCNTPIGGVCGRLLGEKYHIKTVIYQAHGFHFYKGSPALNWILYYPIEKWLAHKTDAIITINREDYELAQKKFHLKSNGKVYYVPGVGIDTNLYKNEKTARIKKRQELGLSDSDIALISMGDLIERKNYPLALRAIAKTKNCHLHYYVCGSGPDENDLRELSRALGIEKQIHFLGFRTDVKELLNAADVFVLTSKQEGLARSLMEGMASGLPCIASKIRGNTDILDSEGGFLVNDVDGIIDALNRLEDAGLRHRMAVHNLEKITSYSVCEIAERIESTYSSEISGGGIT